MGLLLVVVLSIAHELPFAQTLITAVVFACFLQFGYLISAVLRHAVGPVIVVDRETRLGESEVSLRPRERRRASSTCPNAATIDAISNKTVDKSGTAKSIVHGTHAGAQRREPCPIAPISDTGGYAA
jgi:hypothetical protein